MNTYGTFQSFYKSHLLSKTANVLIPLIGGTQAFFILLLSFIAGRLLDAGFHRILAITGGLLITGGMFLLSISAGSGGKDEGKYWAIWLSQGLIVGLGMGCYFVYSSQVVASWFPRRRGFAIGVAASGASCGESFIPSFLPSYISAYDSDSLPYTALPYPPAALTPTRALLTIPHPTPAGLCYPVMFKFLVARYGFPIAVRLVATVVGLTCILTLFTAFPDPSAPLRKPTTWLSLRAWADLHAFKSKPYVWYVAAISWVFLGFYPIFFNLENWAQWRGIGVKEDVAAGTGGLAGEGGFRTFYFLSIMNGSSTLGRVGGAWLADRWGALNVHIVMTFLAGLFIMTFWVLTSNLASGVAFVVLFGAVSGAVIGLPPACVASFLSENDQDRLGQWTGMMYTISAPAALVGPIIAGQLVMSFGYLPIFGWSGGCLLLASFCMVVARYLAGGLKKWTAMEVSLT